MATGVAEGTIRNSYKDLYPYASRIIPASYAKEEDLKNLCTPWGGCQNIQQNDSEIWICPRRRYCTSPRDRLISNSFLMIPTGRCKFVLLPTWTFEPELDGVASKDCYETIASLGLLGNWNLFKWTIWAKLKGGLVFNGGVSESITLLSKKIYVPYV